MLPIQKTRRNLLAELFPVGKAVNTVQDELGLVFLSIAEGAGLAEQLGTASPCTCNIGSVSSGSL